MKFKIGDIVELTNRASIYSKERLGGEKFKIICYKPDDRLYHTKALRELPYPLSETKIWYWYESEIKLVKPRFDIGKYVGKYVMHVTTEDQAQIFCRYLDSVGKKWSGGKSYLDTTYFDVHKEKTLYGLHTGTYGTDWGFGPYYTILEFDDFDWSDFEMKKFTKADLKNGDVVKFRNGKVGIFITELGMFICKGDWYDLDYYSDDLVRGSAVESSHTIMAVRRPRTKCECSFDAFEFSRGELVYERKEVEEMTLEEVCKALGKEIKIVKEK